MPALFCFQALQSNVNDRWAEPEPWGAEDSGPLLGSLSRRENLNSALGRISELKPYGFPEIEVLINSGFVKRALHLGHEENCVYVKRKRSENRDINSKNYRVSCACGGRHIEGEWDDWDGIYTPLGKPKCACTSGRARQRGHGVGGAWHQNSAPAIWGTWRSAVLEGRVYLPEELNSQKVTK